MRPVKGTYPEYYENYIPLVNQENVNTALERNLDEIKNFAASLPKELEDYAYAPGKWTIKQVFQHIADTERVFAYRALRFARKDPQQPLPFEENDYAANAEVNTRSLDDILQELESVRKASASLFKSFSQETLLLSGATSLGSATVVSLGFFLCGHATHHINVVKDRYLKK